MSKSTKQIDLWKFDQREFRGRGEGTRTTNRIEAKVYLRRNQEVSHGKEMKITFFAEVFGEIKFRTEEYEDLKELYLFVRSRILDCANWDWQKVIFLQIPKEERETSSSSNLSKLEFEWGIGWRAKVGSKTYYTLAEKRPSEEQGWRYGYMQTSTDVMNYGEDPTIYEWSEEVEQAIKSIADKVDFLREALRSINDSKLIPKLAATAWLALPEHSKLNRIL
jgi:hypothetical protein